MVDYIELAALKAAGWRINELAAYYQVHRSTIHNWLTDISLNDPVPQRGEMCPSGEHSMDDAIIKSSGHRECRGCKRKRDREWHRAKYWASKQQA